MNRVLLAALLFAILFSALTCITENIGGTVIYEGYIIYGATYQYPSMDIVTYNGTTVNNTLYLKPGDLIAPHLYNIIIRNDGNNYIVYDNVVVSHPFSVNLSIINGIYDDPPNGWYFYIRFYHGVEAYRLGLQGWSEVEHGQWEIDAVNTSGYRHIVGLVYGSGGEENIFARYENGNWLLRCNEHIYEGSKVVDNLYQDINKLYIMTPSPGGLPIYEFTLIYIIVDNKYYLDPTFFNGTYYTDITGKIIGIPYGVERVEADKKWLWVVRNYTGQPYILLKSFNENSSWIIDGELYSDGAQFIGEGLHEIILYYPVNATGVAITGLPNNAIVAVYDLDSDKAYFGLSSNGTALIRIPYSIKHARIVLYTSSEQDYEKPWYNDPGSIVTIVLISTVLGYFVIKIIRYIEEHF